ncbi:N-acetylmuramoyl-L-alanine amidase [Alloacidobacterium dinghuense]|uniref:N-acetylmuramoyl-L-alanine amidase n=1 Tax=Alloacidobacterium dinghuense TaxID=2763107 RepID=A0A7G8BIC3_9BACT|nr:N-acetylmuramoyl-L-alanine amidase [Alloacidobacterium dinghuense]QNI32293.1 N-acetylmuramoyl-L-alanine amidase [Alloacidobacterium dinghuense]
MLLSLCALLAISAAAAQEAPPPQSNLPDMGKLPAVPPAQRAQVQPQYVVVLDAAHGDGDVGAQFSDKMLEKDLTLGFSVRLRQALASQGIQVITTRDADTQVSMVTRAETANHAMAAACVTLHATATGSGVHLFTSSLAPTPYTKFLPWQSAQSAYVTQSLRLSSEISTALGHAAVPVTLGRTALTPMDSFACPAVAVEIAPLIGGNTTTATPLTDVGYQNKIIGALTAALTQWKNDWRQQP